MQLRGTTFKARCINNMYKDFGNHTGFRYVDTTHKHLVVGEWYVFKKSKGSFVDLIIDGKKVSYTGYSFKTNIDEYVPEIYNFYKFFSKVSEDRNVKFSKI